MKKIIYILLFIVSLLYALSCSKDNGNYDYTDVGDIVISGIDDSYRVLSYTGDKLEINPEIESKYKDSELEYFWYLIDISLEDSSPFNSYEIDESKYKAELISTDKNLSYEVNKPLSSYNLVFKVVSKVDGLANFKIIPVVIGSRFSTGYYILKEKSDGNTGLDLLLWNQKSKEDSFLENVLDIQGVSLDGAPRALSPLYGYAYRVEDQQKSANTLCITTEKNDIKILNVEDLSVLKDLSNMFYNAPTGDFVPYTTIRGYFSIYHLSNQGISDFYATDAVAGLNFGKFPIQKGGGASKYVVYSDRTSYLFYWNNTEHAINSVDFNGSLHEVEADTVTASKVAELPASLLIQLDRNKFKYKVAGLNDLKCIATGQNVIGEEERIYFLLEDNQQNRYLYLLEQPEGKGVILIDIIALDKSLNLAQSDIFSTNGRQATIIYCVNNNKLYSHNLNYSGIDNSAREKELILSGIPDDEVISYVTNQYWTNDKNDNNSFDYLIVATQKDNNYTIYLFETLGGEPNGAPVKVVRGTGKTKSIKFISESFDLDSDHYPRTD